VSNAPNENTIEPADDGASFMAISSGPNIPLTFVRESKLRNYPKLVNSIVSMCCSRFRVRTLTGLCYVASHLMSDAAGTGGSDY
jgi:hypothetical protein